MRSSSGTFLPGSVGACLEHRNFIGIAQKFYRNQFIFTGKTQEQKKKIPALGLDRQQVAFFRGTLVDDLLPAFPLPFFFSLFKNKAFNFMLKKVLISWLKMVQFEQKAQPDLR
jgi:hypothetical protein